MIDKSRGKTKPVRVGEDLLTAVRTKMREQLEPRLRKVTKPEGGYKHADPNFVYFYGPDLERLSDSEIITHALMFLTDHIRYLGDNPLTPRPPGTCGIPAIDDITPGDHLGDRPRDE